jgi:hypothetical protein
MSHSMYRADRRTHIKVVVVGFLCAIVVVIVGSTARLGDLATTANADRSINPDRIITRAVAPSVVTRDADNVVR